MPSVSLPPMILPPGERIVTIGTFDGVHRGHRRLLEQAVQRGGELGLPVTGVTFEPVPAAVLRPDAFLGRISTPEDKLARLAEAGLDEIVVVPFTPELSRMVAGSVHAVAEGEDRAARALGGRGVRPRQRPRRHGGTID